MTVPSWGDDTLDGLLHFSGGSVVPGYNDLEPASEGRLLYPLRAKNFRLIGIFGVSAHPAPSTPHRVVFQLPGRRRFCVVKLFGDGRGDGTDPVSVKFWVGDFNTTLAHWKTKTRLPFNATLVARAARVLSLWGFAQGVSVGRPALLIRHNPLTREVLDFQRHIDAQARTAIEGIMDALGGQLDERVSESSPHALFVMPDDRAAAEGLKRIVAHETVRASSYDVVLTHLA